VVGGEVEQVRGVGAVPAVDRLVGISHHGQVGPVAEPGAQQPLLERVDILVLVYEQVAEPPALGGRERRVGGDGIGGQGEEVVEVDQAAAALVGLVAAVPLGDALEVDGHPAVGLRGGDGVAVRGDESGARPLDLRGEVRRRDPRRAAEDPPEDAALAVEQRGRRGAGTRPAGAELGVGDGVERARGGQVPQAEGAQPGVELSGRLAREREGQDVARVGGLGEAAVGDAPGEDPGLAGPGAGQDRQRLRRGGDGAALRGVEPFEQAVRIHGASVGRRGRW
jgi:hypothetical protein